MPPPAANFRWRWQSSAGSPGGKLGAGQGPLFRLNRTSPVEFRVGPRAVAYEMLAGEPKAKSRYILALRSLTHA